MTLSPVTEPTASPSPAPDAAVCDACPHGTAAHDRIGQRFCSATLEGALTRGCICRTS